MNHIHPLQALEKCYGKFSPAQENSEESFTWISGIAHPLLNAVMHLKTDKNINDKVEAILAKTPAGIPLTFWVHPQNSPETLGDVLKEKGFSPMMTCPLMSCPVKKIEPPRFEIEKAQMDLFHKILAAVFQFDESVKQAYAKLLQNVEAEHYILKVNGHAAGTGTLIPNGKIGGIFNIAVLAEDQKKGYAQAMMQFLMNRAFDQRLESLVLLSSPQAEKLYLKSGFSKCFDIKIYGR